MNFASLLRIHQNRQAPPIHSPNQFLLNCNRKLDQPMVYGTNNYSGIKKRQYDMMQPFSQNLFDIYQSFEENPQTQWILELQAHNVRIHKFKPSKLKLRKEDHDIHQQQLYPKLTHQRLSHNQDENQPIPPQNQLHPQQRKNYSPMQKMRPKTFGRNDNFMESLNQNKFSFGEDSGHIVEEDHHSRQPQINNRNCIQERNEYELPANTVDQKSKPYCVNLMNEFNKCDQFGQSQGKILENKNQPIINRKPVNQLANVQREIVNDPQKRNQSNIDFNPNVGFSFEEIDKICQPTQNTIGPVSQNKVQIKSQNQVINTNNAIISAKQASAKPEEFQSKTVEKPNLNRQTSLKNIIQQSQKDEKVQEEQSAQKINFKPVQNPSSEQKQRESSPHRIYCKAVIRNLTPEKFKYPRIDSKNQSNTEVKPFLPETETKKEKAENGTKVNTEKKPDSNETEKKMVTVPSSERLLALIDESKRLLESRTVNEDNKAEDRIKRIVLHQNSNNETETPQPKDNLFSQNKNLSQNLRINPLTQTNPKITINAPKQAVQAKQANLNSTPQRRQQGDTQKVTSPKSSSQQKPKFHNQLANMETNYTPQKTAPQNPLNRPSITITNPSPKNANHQVTQQFFSATQTKIHAESTNGGQQQQNQQQQNQQQQNYFQSNYAYKPLNLPQQYNKTEVQKEVQGYKPYQYNGQGVNQPYQPSTNNYQAQNDATYQAQKASPPIYPYTGGPAMKTYSPYFPVSTATNKPSTPLQPQTQLKPQTTNTVYQTYTYSGFSSSNQPVQIPPSTQPLTLNNNNYIKINANYISPLEKYEQKTEQKDLTQNQLNLDWKQKENLKPLVGLGIEGIKCVESKIYEPSNKITSLQSDPKESSVEFSLRIEEHFHIGNK